MQKITSRDNQKLKFVRKIRDGKENNLIFVEGVRLAKEILRSRLKISECFFSDSFGAKPENQELLSEFSASSTNFYEVSGRIFESLADTKTSQGIILIAEKPETGKEKISKLTENDFNKFPLLILLHQINNPSNLGAILRTAEAVGIKGVILTKNSADVFSAKSLRASLGAAFRLNFWTDADFEDVLEWAREKNLTTVCADINAGKSFRENNWLKPTLLIFGSEAHGLSEEDRGKIDESVYIPMDYFSTIFTNVRTATAVGPFAWCGFSLSFQAVPAMSRCAHFALSTNS
jgi:RNA methyltransferase, TrmH family